MFEKMHKTSTELGSRVSQAAGKCYDLFPNLVRLYKNKSGIGAVEFALLAPVLLLLYFSTFELTVAMTVTGKVSRSSSTVADLVASQTSVDKAFLTTMPDVIASIMAPYSPGSATTLKVSGIQVDASGNPKIAWSWDKSGGRPYAVGSAAAIPADLKVANTYLLRSELGVPYSTLVYMPGLAYSQLSSMTFTKVYYYAPRVGTSVHCTNC